MGLSADAWGGAVGGVPPPCPGDPSVLGVCCGYSTLWWGKVLDLWQQPTALPFRFLMLSQLCSGRGAAGLKALSFSRPEGPETFLLQDRELLTCDSPPLAPLSDSALPVFCCRLIALEMAKIHTIHANGSLPKPTLWHKIHSYFALVKNEINPRYEDLREPEASAVAAALAWPPAQPARQKV